MGYLIKGFGYFVEFCTSAACTLGFDSIIKPTGVKVIDKVIVPTGTFAMTYCISTKVAETVMNDAQICKEGVEALIEARKLNKDLNENIRILKADNIRKFEPELANKLNSLIDAMASGKITTEEYGTEMDKLKMDMAEQIAKRRNKTVEQVLQDAGLSTDILKEETAEED